MTELIQVRVKALAAILILILMMPTATAHGANTFSFIMRNESIQPDTAQVIQNDTLIFVNTADYDRRVVIDSDGDGTDEMDCIAGPSNSSSTDDECYLWLEPANWSEGGYEVRIYSNGSLWQTIDLTMVLDNHTETLPPDGFVFVPDPGEPEEDDLASMLLSAAVLMTGAAAIIWVFRNVKGDEEG
ncbi:MAG TPA: hypothetical protein EYQ15_03860 [Candidatus Poseidoniales archaeon]|jgi:hypothetical protein|nr:MAG: hypothetical protein CXT65_00370 [Euryarchaeota archaeon]HIG38425.1 hypothetical protein [Candidatus Poseidoniales archaeon]HIL43653.1 hypothetical protein [Candidatus Poseidoniales archaeon]